MAKDPLEWVKDPFTRKCLENCKELGKAMQAARERAGLTRREAAERIGTSESYLTKCEHNQQKIPIYLVVEYSRLFRTPLNDLIGGLGDKTARYSNNDYIGQLNEILPALPDQIVRAFYLIARVYFNKEN